MAPPPPPQRAHLAKFAILGNLFLLLGLLINLGLPPLIERLIDTQLVLTPGSRSFPLWKEVPVPIYQKFYLFNVTNPEEIEHFGARPQLQQVGPFTYRSDWSKRELRDNGTRLSFKHFKEWHFERDLSVEDDRLQVTTLNAPLAITLSLIQSASSPVRILVTLSLDGLSESFFTRRSVRQLLFAGYPDLLTTFGPLLNSEMFSQAGHFGYMSGRNRSLDGAYEVNSGSRDIHKLNTIHKFNGHSHLNYWHNHLHLAHGGPCNSLEGATMGDLFPPLASNQSQLKLFQPDFCRVWPLDYQQDLEHSSGLHLKRFLASRDVFRNATDLPQNACFFKQRRADSSSSHASQQVNNNRVHNNNHRQARQQQQHADHHQTANNNHRQRNRHEWPAGVFTLAPCKFNAPIYISMPHFLDADPYFGQQVEGLEPDSEKHQFYLDLEPRTGSPVALAARVQLNVAISKPPGLVRFRNVPEIMFPVFWQELTMNLTGPVIDQLLLASKHTQEATLRASYALLVLGLAILSTCAIFYLYQRLPAHCPSLGRLFGKRGAKTLAPAKLQSSPTASNQSMTSTSTSSCQQQQSFTPPTPTPPTPPPGSK